MSNNRKETGAEDSAHSLRNIAVLITSLDELAGELFRVMDEQVASIVTSHHQKVEQFTREHSELKNEFKQQEAVFVEKLTTQIRATFGNDAPVKLEMLKQVYPASAHDIEQWKGLLRENARKLKRKHRELVELLQFAMNRNADVMHTIYQMYNKNNTHYSSTGSTKEVSSGMAINQEA